MTLMRSLRSGSCFRRLGSMAIFLLVVTSFNLLIYQFLYGHLGSKILLFQLDASAAENGSSNNPSSFQINKNSMGSQPHIPSPGKLGSSTPSRSTATSKLTSLSKAESKYSSLKVTQAASVNSTSAATTTTTTTTTTTKTTTTTTRTSKQTATQSASTARAQTRVTASPSTEPMSEPNCGDANFDSKDEKLQAFKPALSGQNLCTLLHASDVLVSELSRLNVSFFMYGGTLIGSWRHHGLVPWDDDVDFAVPIEQQQTVYRALMDLKPHVILDVKQKKRWKLYADTAQVIRSVTWKYPFVDLNFYHQNATHVWDHDIWVFPNFVYPKDWIFPLVQRPFSGRLWPAPQQTEKALRRHYDLDACKTNSYSHRNEVSIDVKNRHSVPCAQLHSALPFVTRKRANGGCNEALVQYGRVLNNFFARNTNC